MTEDELFARLQVLLENLGFDYDRLSFSGQHAYEEIMSIISKLSQ